MKKIMILALLTLFAIPTYSVLAAESPASNNTAQTDRAPYCWGVSWWQWKLWRLPGLAVPEPK